MQTLVVFMTLGEKELILWEQPYLIPRFPLALEEKATAKKKSLISLIIQLLPTEIKLTCWLASNCRIADP